MEPPATSLPLGRKTVTLQLRVCEVTYVQTESTWPSGARLIRLLKRFRRTISVSPGPLPGLPASTRTRLISRVVTRTVAGPVAAPDVRLQPFDRAITTTPAMTMTAVNKRDIPLTPFAGPHQRSFAAIGSSSQKTDPSPLALWKLIVPPCASTSERAIGRPSPVPAMPLAGAG